MTRQRCFFAGVRGGCKGRLQRAHLVPQRVLRAELGAEIGQPCLGCGAAAWEPCVGRRGRMKGYHRSRRDAWLKVVWDPRCWSWMCERHHRALDDERSLRIPRHHLPEAVEIFAAQHGLEWWLEREYGPRRMAA